MLNKIIINILIITYRVAKFIGVKSPKNTIRADVKNKIVKNPARRSDGIEKQTLYPHYSRATLLDPRFKKVAFGLESNANEAEKCVVSEIATLVAPNTGHIIQYLNI